MKKLIVLLITALLLVSFRYTTNNENPPMLTRHDKDDAEFIKLAEKFEKYICHLNLPDCEGTIIADQWAISAAHCVEAIAKKFNNGRKHFVIINDVEIEVDKVILYKEWDEKRADIALLHLKSKPNNTLKAKLYIENDEVDKLIYMLGRGDKGNGLIGVNGNDGKQRGATNRIETATKNWITWTFDHPDTKTKYLTEYEGISGPGDSGGPAFIIKNDTVYLAGVSAWQDTKGGEEGLYGVVEHYTRVSQYIQWINDEITGNNNNSSEILRVEPKPDAIDYRPKIIEINTSTLKQYVGEYEVKNTTIKIYTKENGTKLYLFVDGQPEYELIPTGKNEFHFKLSLAYKIKFEDQEKDIFKKLIATQPEGIYIAIRK
ncbi:MAG: trypsin-like serine protease [Tenacibaculum sp.]